MESSRTSSNASATNTVADKPDELVSSGDVRQLNSSQGQHGEPVTTAQGHVQLQQLNQQQQQQKKCLHHRIFDANTGNIVNERVAALTNALLQQVNQQNLSQATQQLIQRPYPMQQQSIPQQQSHMIRSHQQQQMQAYQQPQQQYPMQQMPQSIAINNSMMQSSGGFTVGVSNNSMANASTSSTNGSLIHNQNGLVQQMNAALLAERYLLLDLVEGSTLYKCIDVKTHEELVCKVANNPCTNLLSAHFRLDGHPHVNPLHKVIQGSSQTYLFFTPSQGDLHSYVRVRKRLREPEAKRLFRQMCEVVKSCHEQGIVLRDLKLRKFVFADAERTHLRLESLEDAVVLDNPNEDLLQDKRGCPAYVSPEILKANTMYSGKAADMWSLGVILYTMVVGRYPFNDSEHASLFAKISRGQFLVPDCLTSKARCMIRSLLRKEPEERILSEDILLHPWMNTDDNRDFSKSSSDQLVPDICVDKDDV
ncbi:tribbles homolog 2-like [Sitodiplosis mosellana]|uniref:tribbles homolog 2-like n=1 Tax=Sitodiplosis mosellana TaxID=263140 RepID=UPI00244442CA|nr:tribbles homolog 2-like [Sitodiplosis mosellana]